MVVEVGLLADHLDRFVVLVVVAAVARCCVVAADWDRVDRLGSADLDLGIVHPHGGLHAGNLGHCLRWAELAAVERRSVPVPVVGLGCSTMVGECCRGYHRHTASSR